MKKICILFGFLLVVSNAQADATRISNELATVKACNEVLHYGWLKSFDLTNITDASTSDSGKTIKVSLHFTAEIEMDGAYTAATCTSSNWYKYDGTATSCEPCQDPTPGTSCACAGTMCTTPDGRVLSM